MSNTKVTIESVVEASPKKVWDFWNNPEHITQWNAAADDWHCPSAENDLRVGGTLKSRMEARDGSFGFDFEAVYSEIINHKKIAYSLSDGRKVETTFEDLNGKTKVKTVFDAENENPIDMQREGWQAILNNFKTYTESH